MTILAQLISWLNTISNSLFHLLDKPITILPTWLSLGIISAVLGVLMLILFKYTSNQTAIGKVRDAIKANLLAMKLFKDNPKVILKAPWQTIAQAFLLLFLAIPPLLVMILPFSLIMGQLGLWYESRPLAVGDQAVIKVQLTDYDGASMPTVLLEPSDAVEVTVGPVHVPSEQQIFWKIQAKETGLHHLIFKVADQQVQKELAVGHGLMPISTTRPGLHFEDLILHPAEKPFQATSLIQSISIEYPARYSSFLGIGLWFWMMLVIALVAGFIFKPFFNVKI